MISLSLSPLSTCPVLLKAGKKDVPLPGQELWHAAKGYGIKVAR